VTTDMFWLNMFFHKSMDFFIMSCLVLLFQKMFDTSVFYPAITLILFLDFPILREMNVRGNNEKKQLEHFCSACESEEKAETWRFLKKFVLQIQGVSQLLKQSGSF